MCVRVKLGFQIKFAHKSMGDSWQSFYTVLQPTYLLLGFLANLDLLPLLCKRLGQQRKLKWSREVNLIPALFLL